MMALRAAARQAWSGFCRSLDAATVLRVVLLDRGSDGGTATTTPTASSALTRILLLNGVVYLGWGCLFLDHVLCPWIEWLLESQVTPVFGPATAASWLRLLRALASALFSLPAYGVALAASCAAYQRLADAACAFFAEEEDRRRKKMKKEKTSSSAASPPPPPPLESAAATLFRLVLYAVLTAEAALLGALVPRIGRAFGAWAAGFFAYDCKWERQGVALERRLLRGERDWAFLLGFGLVAAGAAALLPIRQGAAVLNCLLSGMVVIACGGAQEEEEEDGGPRTKPPPLPLFALARAPAEAILRLVF
jgi:hypothetical protein